MSIICDFMLVKSNERYAWFQQDGDPSHTAAFFDELIIANNLWPPLTVTYLHLTFFLFGMGKDYVSRKFFFRRISEAVYC